VARQTGRSGAGLLRGGCRVACAAGDREQKIEVVGVLHGARADDGVEVDHSVRLARRDLLAEPWPLLQEIPRTCRSAWLPCPDTRRPAAPKAPPIEAGTPRPRHRLRSTQMGFVVDGTRTWAPRSRSVVANFRLAGP
jgi:hypothetical protein